MDVINFENATWNLPFLLEDGASMFQEVIEKLNEVLGFVPVKYLAGFIPNAWNTHNPLKTFLFEDIFLPKALKDFNIKPIIDFSYYSITEEDLNNKCSNDILDIFHYNYSADFEVSSDLLYDYIKKKYPDVNLIASHHKSDIELEAGKEVDYYKRLLDKYERVVLSPSYVKTSFLNDVEKYEDTSRFEIILNNSCVMNCPVLKDSSIICLNDKVSSACPKNNMSYRELFDNSLSLSIDEVDNILKNSNITSLKLEGYNFRKREQFELIMSYIFKKFGIATLFMYNLKCF